MVLYHVLNRENYFGCKDTHCFAISMLFVEKVIGMICIYILFAFHAKICQIIDLVCLNIGLLPLGGKSILVVSA